MKSEELDGGVEYLSRERERERGKEKKEKEKRREKNGLEKKRRE